jgi:hypothetical protein
MEMKTIKVLGTYFVHDGSLQKRSRLLRTKGGGGIIYAVMDREG